MMVFDICSWCDGEGDDGCGWFCLHCDGQGRVEVDLNDFADEPIEDWPDDNP